MSDAVDVLKRSVTLDDYVEGAHAGSIMHFMLPAIGASPDLPGFWSYARDWMLYSTIYRESMWAAAVYLAVTKQASKSWEVESDIPKRQKDAQQLFLHFNSNRGWVSGISKHLQAYVLTGNGGPVEIVRASGAPGAKVIGLVPLDPFRTIRTGDPDIPYLYTDRRGAMHELRDYDAFCITDQPDMMDLWYGVGHCAAERAYKAIEKLETIERYIYEKVSGKRALALDFVSGVIPDQIKQAQDTARNESSAKGVYTYLGSTIIALAGDQAPQHVRVNLAELPDGFARKEEFDIAVLTYARALGIPVQDLQPLSGQGLGTGAQTQVLEESAKGQGMATWGKAFGHAVNEFALDTKTTFYFRENDIRDREREAKVKIDEATAIKTWVDMQAITIEQARQLGVDRDQLPQEFVAVDNTPGGTLSDSEKPTEASEVTPTDTEIPIEAATQPTEQTAPVETDAILKDARRIYESITGKVLETPTESIDNKFKAQADEIKRIESESQAFRAALTESNESIAASLKQTMAAIDERVKSIPVSVPDSTTLKALVDRAAVKAAESVALTLKHAEDLTVKQEIVEVDRNGLASKVRRTLASGETTDFRVLRDGNGRIKRLEKI